MTALRIAWTELSRLLSIRMGRITVLALVTVPTIYAGLYLYANHDPYAALNRVPTALVVEDTGATGIDGTPMKAGRAVADQLLESKDFGWHEVDRTTAQAGVDDGTYDFALIIPRDFSAALTSASGTDPEQAKLTMLTNDANSYLSTTIANTVATKVRDAISERVSKEAVGAFLVGIADVRGGLQQGADGAGKLYDGLKDARRGARRLVAGSERLAGGADDVGREREAEPRRAAREDRDVAAHPTLVAEVVDLRRARDPGHVRVRGVEPSHRALRVGELRGRRRHRPAPRHRGHRGEEGEPGGERGGGGGEGRCGGPAHHPAR